MSSDVHLFYIYSEYEDPGLVVAGLITVLIFYGIIFAVGIYASWRGRKQNNTTDDVMLAGRSIGLVMGAFTMTGTTPSTYSINKGRTIRFPSIRLEDCMVRVN